MVENQSPQESLALTIDRIYERLAKGDAPSGEVVRQEVVRSELPMPIVETMLSLDKRFARRTDGWEVCAADDRWPDLVRALPDSLSEGAAEGDLFRQALIEMSAATRADLCKHYPPDFVFSVRLRKRIAKLVESCPDDSIGRLRGPIFDLAMSELFDNAEKNRFFTPRAITEFATAWALPQPGERIIDPCFGSGGFLLAMAQALERLLKESGVVVEDHSDLFQTSFRYVMDLDQDAEGTSRVALDKMLYGMDYDQISAWSGKTNIALHGLGGSNLYQQDALDLQRIPFDLESFEIVAGNPPFGDKISDPAILTQFQLGQNSRGNPLSQQSSEVLFLEAFVRLAVPGGRIVILVPDGVLANTGEQRVRDYLVRHVILEAVIGLPRRVFRNDAKSNVLLLRRKHAPNERQECPVFLAATENITTDLSEALQQLQAGSKHK